MGESDPLDSPCCDFLAILHDHAVYTAINIHFIIDPLFNEFISHAISGEIP